MPDRSASPPTQIAGGSAVVKMNPRRIGAHRVDQIARWPAI